MMRVSELVPSGYDPMGRVTDAVTGQPITNARVTLHHVPGWSPRTNPSDSGPNTCESNLSKDADAPWSQPAPIDQGVVIDRESTLIAPPISSKSTDSNGAYGWDILAGCWYVRVTADGYEPITSAVVGVPSAVTDLDLTLRPTLTSSVTPASASAEPGDVIEASLRLFNGRSSPMVVDLSQANILEWEVQGLSETVTIDANSEQEFPFSIIIPATVQLGTSNAIYTVAILQDDPTVEVEARVVVQIGTQVLNVYLPVVAR